MKRSARSVEGFLLIEALVTIVIFIVGVTTIAAYHGMSVHRQFDACKRAHALAIACTCIEHCRAKGCLPQHDRSEQEGIVLTWHTHPFSDAALAFDHTLVVLTLEVQWHAHQGVEHRSTLVTIINLEPLQHEVVV